MDMISYLLGYVAGKKGGSGGGTVEGVHFVTFMSEDGMTELYKRPVADGDDCADPVARGLMSTPTKESTVQYNYTYSGWSLTGGGSANSNALKAVTEDRVVYAAYAPVLRAYTITYYDGATQLTTERVTYGGSGTYTPPAKDGYFFDKWEPSNANITGDTACYAQYKVDIDFATASWEDIVAVAESGDAQTYFKVGDTRPFTFTDPDGTSRTTTLRIVGFNHDDLADGSGKAAISIMSSTAEFAAQMNDQDIYVGDPGYTWADQKLRTTLNGTLLSNFPAALKNGIKSVTKTSRIYVDGEVTTGLCTTQDSLWIPSLGELNYTSIYAGYGVSGGDSEAYANLYASAFTDNSNSSSSGFWVRSGSYKSVRNVIWYRKDISAYSAAARTTKLGIIFGFCI